MEKTEEKDGHPKVTFHALRVVEVRIRGERKDSESPLLMPRDEALVGKFMMHFLNDNIFPVRMAHCGPGMYLGYFLEEDMPKIRSWLAENGVEEVEFIK